MEPDNKSGGRDARRQRFNLPNPNRAKSSKRGLPAFRKYDLTYLPLHARDVGYVRRSRPMGPHVTIDLSNDLAHQIISGGLIARWQQRLSVADRTLEAFRRSGNNEQLLLLALECYHSLLGRP